MMRTFRFADYKAGWGGEKEEKNRNRVDFKQLCLAF